MKLSGPDRWILLAGTLSLILQELVMPMRLALKMAKRQVLMSFPGEEVPGWLDRVV